MVDEHECRESRTCTCYKLALEPDDSCPVHGAGPWPPRCEICGRFLPWEVRRQEEERLMQETDAA